MTQTPLLLAAVLLWTSSVVLAAEPDIGTWTAVPGTEGLSLDLRRQEQRMGVSLPRAELRGLDTSDGADTRFQLVREAGTFQFEGRFTAGQGAGHYRFEPSASWHEAMAKLGHTNFSAEEQFQATLFDLGPTRVKALAELGYAQIPREQLLEVAIFQVTPEHIRALKAAGVGTLTLRELIDARIHRVTPAFIREIREAGHPSVTFEQLVRLRIHSIDAAYIRSLSTGRSKGRP